MLDRQAAATAHPSVGSVAAINPRREKMDPTGGPEPPARSSRARGRWLPRSRMLGGHALRCYPAWPGDLFTSRHIAVMLLAIAIGAVYALRHADVSRVMPGVVAVQGFGVMLANLWSILASKPVNPAYVVAFGIVSLVSATLLIAERQNAVQRSGPPEEARLKTPQARNSLSNPGARNRQTSAASTSGSTPTAAEKRIFGTFSVRIV
jgi:hypothetical protein